MIAAADMADGSRRRLATGSVLALASAIIAAVPAKASDFNPQDLALIDRLTWGVSVSSAEHLRAVGLERWLEPIRLPTPIKSGPRNRSISRP